MKQERVQSIYGKGFDDGFKAAKEELKREGWRKVTARDDLSIGDIVRPMVRTMFGVKWPESKVVGFNGNTVQCLRLTHWKSLDRWEYPPNLFTNKQFFQEERDANTGHFHYTELVKKWEDTAAE